MRNMKYGLVPVFLIAFISSAIAEGYDKNDCVTNSELILWQSAERGGTQEEYTVFLEEYPDSKFSQIAAIRIEKLEKANTVFKVPSASNQADEPETEGVELNSLFQPVFDSLEKVDSKISKYFTRSVSKSLFVLENNTSSYEVLERISDKMLVAANARDWEGFSGHLKEMEKTEIPVSLLEIFQPLYSTFVRGSIAAIYSKPRLDAALKNIGELYIVYRQKLEPIASSMVESASEENWDLFERQIQNLTHFSERLAMENQ